MSDCPRSQMNGATGRPRDLRAAYNAGKITTTAELKKLPFRMISFVSALFLVGSLVALAQSAGMFTPTGSLTTPRDGYTATLLPNGKVLIAGGNSAGAEL
jgi:hypothetical protein